MDENDLIFSENLIEELNKRIKEERELLISKIEEEREKAEAIKKEQRLEIVRKLNQPKVKMMSFEEESKINATDIRRIPKLSIQVAPKESFRVEHRPLTDQYDKQTSSTDNAKLKRSPPVDDHRPHKIPRLPSNVESQVKRHDKFVQTTHPQTQKYPFPTIVRIPSEYIMDTLGNSFSYLHFSSLGARSNFQAIVCKFSVGSSCKYGDKCNMLHIKPEFWEMYDRNPMLYSLHENVVDESRDPRRRVANFSVNPPMNSPPPYSPQTVLQQHTYSNPYISRHVSVPTQNYQSTIHTPDDNTIRQPETIVTEKPSVRFAPLPTEGQEPTYFTKQPKPERVVPDWWENIIWTGDFLDSHFKLAFRAKLHGTNAMCDKFSLDKQLSFQLKGTVKTTPKLLSQLKSRNVSLGSIVEIPSENSTFSKLMKQMVEKNCGLYIKGDNFRMYCLNPETQLVKKLRFKLPHDRNKRTMYIILYPTEQNKDEEMQGKEEEQENQVSELESDQMMDFFNTNEQDLSSMIIDLNAPPF
jgi:hypothetical protein